MFRHCHETTATQPLRSRRPERGRNLLEVLCTFNVDDSPNLTRVSHELLGASVHHARLGIARAGEVVEHDVGHRQTAVGL